MRPVTDPALLAQLNGEDKSGQPVTDPNLLAQLNNSTPPQPGASVSLGTAFAVASELAPWNVARSLTTEPLGEKTAEGIGYAGGRLGIPHSGEVGAAIGTAVQMAPDLLAQFAPGPKTTPRNIFSAKPTPQTIEGVQAAARYGVPLTRAEVTGSRSDSLLESGFEKTLTGSDQMQAARQAQATAVEAAKDTVQGRYGTQLPPSSIGQEAQLGMRSEMGQAAATNRRLWSDIPDVPIETPKLSQALDDAVRNQSNIQDPKVVSVVGRIREALTRQSPITEAGSASSVKPIQPVTQGPPRFNELQKARKFLNDAIDAETSWDPVLGMKTTDTGRQLQQVKSALDSDISSFGSTGSLPVVKPGATTGEPHALFAYKDNFGPGGTERSIYNVYGEKTHPLIQQRGWGSSVPKEDLDKLGIPITGRQPNAPLGVNDLQADQFKTAFQKAKTFHGAFKQLTGSKVASKVSNTAASDMVDSVLKPGRIEDVHTAKALMGEEAFGTLKQGFFNRLIESKNIGRELSKYDDEFLNSVFNKNELQSLKDMVAIKGRALGAEKLAGNPSGTGQTLGTFGTGVGLANAARKLITGHPIDAVADATALLGGPLGGANLYLKYGVKGIPLTSEATGALAQRGGLAANSLSQNQRRILLEELISRTKRRQ